jgi:hypothetical protein
MPILTVFPITEVLSQEDGRLGYMRLIAGVR